MLIRSQRKILDTLLSIEKTNVLFSHQELLSKAQIYNETELVRACQSLHNDGYIDVFSMNILGEITLIQLSDKGANYKEYRKLEHHKFWRESILTPILVTIATTAVIGLLKSLWPLILEWLSMGTS